jgi:hypothetical protein
LPAAEKLNADARVEAVLTQMTLDEKIGQMVQVDMKAVPDRTGVRKYFLGSVLSAGSSDPASGNTAQDWLQQRGRLDCEATAGSWIILPKLHAGLAWIESLRGLALVQVF